MLFNSLPFLCFIPLFFALYFGTSGKARLWVCLMGSYLFYGWWDWRFLFLIQLLTLISYYSALKIGEYAEEPKKKARFRMLSVVSSLVVLGFFKYFNFFADNVVSLFGMLGMHASYTTLTIILPVGISFYTFQTIGYTVDVYRGKIPVERSLLNFAVYVAFFPQLVAGPIVRASNFLPQLREDQPISGKNVILGLQMILWGYVLKSVVADSLSLVVDPRFNDPFRYDSFSLFIGAFFYSFQIYGDFAGYSYIAIGIAKILGIDFRENFNRPYFSSSFSEFWQRWHISLSSWLRDYLYIPLGGNRQGKLRTDINRMLTMLLGGLWHGASWNFVIWGGLHGLYLMLQRVVRTGFDSVFPHVNLKRLWFKIPLVLLIYAACNFAWIFFRAETLAESGYIVGRLFDFGSYHIGVVPHMFHVMKGFALILMVIVLELFAFIYPLEGYREKTWFIVASIAASLLLIGFLGTFGNAAFIYFQF